MGTNPMYEAQLNRHEDAISDINGRLHSHDLALKWCEGQIKRIAGEDKESLEQHNDNQRKEINNLLKANEELKKEIQGLKTKLGVVFAEKEKVRGDYERLRQDNPFEKEYDTVKNNYYILKEDYEKLDNRYEREKEIWSEKCNELQNSIDLKNRRITSLEQGTKTQSDVIDQKNSEICYLRSEIEKWKDAYLRSQVDVDNFQRSYTAAKIANDGLTKCLAKYAWRRVSNLEPSTTDDLEDHELYLFVVDGYPTPVKGKYHDESPSYITIIVDDGDGRGTQYKALFFMDGVIRYWMPLPEMPDTVK